MCGRLAVDFLDELHHRSGGDGGSDKNLSRPRRAPPRPFDFRGALALLIGYPALLLGLTFAANHGWTSRFVVGWFAVVVIALAIFFGLELHTTKPLIDVAIFRHKMLAAALLAVALSNMIHYPIALCAPLYLQNVLGSSA